MIPVAEPYTIALRAYTASQSSINKTTAKKKKLIQVKQPSEYILIFDTETLTNESQALRFGVYQIRKNNDLMENGIFFDPSNLLDQERSILYSFAVQNQLMVRTIDSFIEEIFYVYAYELRGLCVGFNLPFDLSRLAIKHASARGYMKGGYSFTLSPDRYKPALQIKHRDSKTSFIRFTHPAKQLTPRGMRKRGYKVAKHNGFFLDVKTFACALLSGNWSLAKLSHHLQVEHPKLVTDEHGEMLTREYLEYAIRDVQTTMECYQALQERFNNLGIKQTHPCQIYSEASIGKSYLKEMGVTPWRQLQPDFPEEVLGIIMSTYYGGRSEAHIRREITPVLYCDFTSMYPTVCTLMGLWQFVIAKKLVYEDATKEIQELLQTFSPNQLQEKGFWQKLPVLVQVLPEADLFPIRALYEKGHYTIGINYLTSKKPPLWFTLADVLQSYLSTGKIPKVLQALRFYPSGKQTNLHSIKVAGKDEHQIDPYTDDLYQAVIDHRLEVKSKIKQTKDELLLQQLETEQLSLKIMANATSYGIFAEENPRTISKLEEITCFGGTGSYSTRVEKIEEHGKYFHPLLATLITGAARLMLATAEYLALQQELSWAFCDTDSMALAQPCNMTDETFLERAFKVQRWFNDLNPYHHEVEIFKLEETNFSLKNTKELEKLYCFAIAAKRYVLFNKNGDQFILRKASAHGLGHLLAPYTSDEAPKIIPRPLIPLPKLGVERWQHDLWYRIIQAVYEGHAEQINLADLPGFQRNACSRYAATSPHLLQWFKGLNTDRTYEEQVKPFNFLLSFQSKDDPFLVKSRPIASYTQNIDQAANLCFDRESGALVPIEQLQTYQEVIAHYHLHPESKFLNGDFLDHGTTQRRHIYVEHIEYIGKEANHWEEQFYLGFDEEQKIIYPNESEELAFISNIAQESRGRFSYRQIAEEAGVSVGTVFEFIQQKRNLSQKLSKRIISAIKTLEKQKEQDTIQSNILIEQIKQEILVKGITKFANKLGENQSNLLKIINGKRKLNKNISNKIEEYFLNKI